ncbi:High mobility group B protein 10, partial [Bienertia sinuspersici]
RQSEEKEENAAAKSNCYPEILGEADYNQLVQNPDFFLQKLKQFHSSFTTNFITPTLGGTTLDLHRLFVEVTSRGGLDQVINDRKWDEVVSVFRSGITSFKRSFLLRKFYLSLLYHFEQAYFLKKKAPAAAITDAAEQITSVRSHFKSTSNFNEDSTTKIHQQASVKIQPGASLIGVIDEKLDNGYVVTVNLGSDTLRGILYHIPDKPQPSWSPNPCIPRRRKRKKSQLSLMDYATLKPISPGQEQSFSNNGQLLNHQVSEPDKQ